jgi:hypothetical protein
VLTPPGHTALTRTPREANSTASALVSMFTPPLLAQYAALYTCPTMAALEAMFTILPFVCSRCGIAAWHMKNTPERLTAIMRCQNSSVTSCRW